MNIQDLELKYKELGAEIERLKAKPTGVWEPEAGKDYWSVGRTATAEHWMRGRHPDSSGAFLSLRAHHNVYKTKELSQKASVLTCRSNLVIQACLNFDPDFEPDWSDCNQVKYGVAYNYQDNKWMCWAFNHYDIGGAYVSTKEKAKQVVEYLNSQEIK